MGTPTSLALQVGAQDQGVSFTPNLVRKANLSPTPLSPTPDLLSQRPSVGAPESAVCSSSLVFPGQVGLSLLGFLKENLAR